MKPEKHSTRKNLFPFGFLSLGLIWGFIFGYVLADWASNSIGYHWYTNPYPHYFNFTVRCFIIGPVVGMVVGLIVDQSIHNKLLRNRLIEFNLIVLIIAVVLYALPFPRPILIRE